MTNLAPELTVVLPAIILQFIVPVALVCIAAYFGAPKFGGAPNKAANAHARNRAAQGRQGANRH